MCLSANNLIFILLVPFIYAQQSDVRIARCLEKGSGDCLINVAENMVEKAEIPDKLEIFPGISLIRSNRTARGMNDLTNRTISFDVQEMTKKLSSGKNDGRSRRRRLIYALVLTAVLAAKASAVATSAALMIPLALVGLSLVATKALIFGKLAVLMAAAFSMHKHYAQTQDRQAEVIYSGDHSDRIDQVLHHAFPMKKKEFHEPYPMYRKH